MAGESFDSLAAYDDGSPAATSLIRAAQNRGLRVTRIPSEDVTAVLPAPGRAWRCPPGFAAALRGHEAGAFAQSFLEALPASDVPTAIVLDVA